MKQHTLRNSYTFTGKCLHTGTVSRIVIAPAPANSGIRFKRASDGAEIPALASYVTSTARSTTLGKDGFSVQTVEHVLSALFGLGIDNATIEVEGVEIPILDGSANPYVQAIGSDGLQEQDAERKFLEITKEITVTNDKGSWVKITPADEPSFDITVDFGSRVLGVQKASFDGTVNYAKEIAPCRTFVFFHEIEFLFANNLIKGGDVDNAIVIVEHPVTEAQVDAVAAKMGRTGMSVRPDGYLSNLTLHYPNECGRHKLLDLIGDLSLSGGPLKAKITAYKPGHGINTQAAAEILNNLKIS